MKNLFYLIQYYILNKKYWLNFVGEFIMNSNYEGYIAGRIEIRDNYNPYSMEEMRYFTNKVQEFNSFDNKWDLKQVSKRQIERIKRIVKEKFCNYDSNRI